jgi:peptide/nickel transport system substrate-binding protein
VIRRASVVVVVVACIATATAANTTTSLTLRIVSAEDVDSLDPALASSEVSLPIVAATCSKLFEFRPHAAVPRAEVAAALPHVSVDGRTYTFTVRDGFRFSDGSEVTAANFAAAIGRVRNPAMQSPWASFTSDITRVVARGPRTLVVRLRRRAGDLVSRLASSWACPVPVGLPADPLGIDDVPGSGPYVVSSRTPGREVVLRRNRFYRGPRVRRPDEVIVTIGGTAAANAEAVEAGRFDYVLYFWLLPPPPGTLLADLAARHGVNRTRFFARPSLGTVYLALNTERPLFRHNPRLRRAVNLALDRAEILRQGGFLRGRRTDQLLPPGMPGFVPRDIYPLGRPALASARRLAAGHLRGGRAVLYVGDEPTAVRRAEVIRFNLARIGLVVEIHSFPRPIMAARAARRGEPFDLVLTGWHAHYADPAEFLVSLLDGAMKPRDNLNLSYFHGRTGEIEAANRLGAPERYRTLGALEVDIMRRDAPVAPLFHPFSYWLLSERVGCFAESPLGVDYGSFCLR